MIAQVDNKIPHINPAANPRNNSAVQGKPPRGFSEIT